MTVRWRLAGSSAGFWSDSSKTRLTSIVAMSLLTKQASGVRFPGEALMACSSIGRVPGSEPGGCWFDPTHASLMTRSSVGRATGC